MMDFDMANDALDLLVADLPQQILQGLGGGIILSGNEKMHPKNINRDLYIMGEYHNEPRGLGRYIVLYYGSMTKVFGNLPDVIFIEKMKKVLHHELTHHLENRAGDYSLEIEDAEEIASYMKRNKKD